MAKTAPGIYLSVDRDKRTGGFQISIDKIDTQGNGHGYRIAGPKFSGSSEPVICKLLDARDAAEITSYLNELSPHVALTGTGDDVLADRWLPIATAPNGVTVLTYRQDAKVSTVPVVGQKRAAQTLGGGPVRFYWVGFSDGPHTIDDPTHWKPLDSIPAAAPTDDWIEWKGGDDLPVSPETLVCVKLRDGSQQTGVADDFGWWHDRSEIDILFYKMAGEGGR